MVRTVEQGDKFRSTSSFVISPTYVPDLVNACLDLIIDGEKGLWHITNPSALSWTEFALLAAEMARLKTGLIEDVSPAHLGYKAARPRFSALRSERGLLMPGLESAIERFLLERAA